MMIIDKLNQFFENAENGVSKIDDGIEQIDGMTGIKTRHLYNNLLTLEDARYLEIGTFKGSSVCAAMCGNSATVVCIDDWSQFNGPKDDFMRNFNRYKGANDATFIEQECFSVDTSRLIKFNIYLYDGDHRYEDQYKALGYYLDCMEDEFIFVVDDWNWENVRRGTNDAIRDLNLKVLWSREVRLPDENSSTQDREGWWNGISVFLLKK
jgi:hypothetical protein